MKTSQYRARKARTWSYCQSTASHKNVETIFPKNPVVLVWQRVCASAEEFLRKGCHCQGKVREKRKFFKVREKSGEIFDIVKVSERSENSFFQFIVHKFSSRLWNAFSFGKDEKVVSMLQSKQRDQFDTLRVTYAIVVVSGFRCEWFLPNSFFLFPRKAEKGWNARERCRWPAKKLKRT